MITHHDQMRLRSGLQDGFTIKSIVIKHIKTIKEKSYMIISKDEANLIGKI